MHRLQALLGRTLFGRGRAVRALKRICSGPAKMTHGEQLLDVNEPACGFAWNRAVRTPPLHLAATLAGGQAFRWRRDESGIWWGVVGELVAALYRDGFDPCGPLLWQTFPEPDRWDVLATYFRLDVDWDALAARWCAAEPRVEAAVRRWRGVRVLRQPPLECLCGFLCATCNTVTKIERSVEKLARRYGAPIEFAGAAPGPFYRFPTAAALAGADEAALRADLWGFRAPRVIEIASRIAGEDPALLESLRAASYAEAKAVLMEFAGIGAKVADCICLFALDKDAAVPVDTHVRQIAARLYPEFAVAKSLTPSVYNAVGDRFRARFGSYAGWLQQILFYAELHRARAEPTSAPAKLV